jgi:hypothetical protein
LEDELLIGYMKELQDIIQKTLKRSNDLLFVTAFGSDTTFRRFWEREYEQQWEEISRGFPDIGVPQVEYVPTHELASRMEHIVVSTIGDQVYALTPISGDPQRYITEIPITVESLRLTYYTINSTSSFTVNGPDGKMIQPDGKDIVFRGANTFIQVMEILKPIPGSYQIATSLSGGIVTQLLRFEQIRAGLIPLVDPWMQFTNRQIGIQVFHTDGSPLTISPQMNIQAALLQADQTNYLDLIPESDTFITSWMPVRSDPVAVYACITLKSSDGSTVILYNSQVGEIKIDPVTVQTGQVGKACVPTEKVTGVPLQLINAHSQQPVAIEAPVQWNSQLSSFPIFTPLSSTIDEVDSQNGEYVLRFKPNFAGDVRFDVRTRAVVDGMRYTFYDDAIPPIVVEPPRQLEVTLGEPDRLGDRLSVMLYRWLNPS